ESRAPFDGDRNGNRLYEPASIVAELTHERTVHEPERKMVLIDDPRAKNGKRRHQRAQSIELERSAVAISIQPERNFCMFLWDPLSRPGRSRARRVGGFDRFDRSESLHPELFGAAQRPVEHGESCAIVRREAVERGPFFQT